MQMCLIYLQIFMRCSKECRFLIDCFSHPLFPCGPKRIKRKMDDGRKMVKRQNETVRRQRKKKIVQFSF